MLISSCEYFQSANVGNPSISDLNLSTMLIILGGEKENIQKANNIKGKKRGLSCTLCAPKQSCLALVPDGGMVLWVQNEGALRYQTWLLAAAAWGEEGT